ncbi:MAG: hypothetical protein ABSG63_20870 [Spirochaetia bacterium]
MSLYYPMQTFGRFGLSYGLTLSFLHARYGLDCGERYHADIAWRVAQIMEIDRQVFTDLGDIGIGFSEPFPRASLEPYGHRFVPALYGCRITYAADTDPAAARRPFDAGEVAALPPWTRERLQAMEPVRRVLEQAAWARGHCDRREAERRMGFTAHAQPLTSLQNLGSVINTAVSVFGEDALLLCMDSPDLLRAFYRNVTDLMLLCLQFFPAVDGRKLSTVFVGDCTVAMISPEQYAACNLNEDRRLAVFARGIGARFLVHQDSGATAHLRGYARLGPVQGIDFGQDTDWEEAAAVFPGAEANCIIFPGWLRARGAREIEEELRRLMRAGQRFPKLSFSLLELDVELAQGKVREFHDAFRRAAETVG